MTWAAGLHPGRGVKSVLMCLADRASDHSGEDWTCFPSIESIMSWTDDSRSSVERHLRTLEAHGYITRKRRRRADGRLGIYDFTLHRDADHRAQLRAERASEPAGSDVKLTCGPDVKSGLATRQNDAQPCVNLTGQEPSGEPSDNPHRAGAREPGDQGVDEVAELWPASGRKRTNWNQARAAWAFACGLETAERLAAAARACAADPDLARGDFGWPGLQTWLSEERWRAFLPKPAEAAEGAAGPRFAGPDALRQAVAARGGAVLLGCLDRAGWDAAGGVVTPATGWAWERLRELEPLFEQEGVALGAPKGVKHGR